MLDFYEQSQAKFSVFYKDLLSFIYKASNSSSEDDYLNIVDAYTTPAERIIKTLMQLKSIDAIKKDQGMEREINYCINKISERKIFATD
jgi:hypothetical protein